MNSPITNAGSAADQVLVFPPDRDIGLLAVDPPYPLGFKPQNDGALGININMVYGDRSGLLVYILAYINMTLGDYIRVFIDTRNAPVAEFSVTEAHFDAQGQAKNIPFYISPRDMEARFEPLKNQNKDFWFEVQRVSGNTEQSPRAPLFYKHPAPGEPDTDGGKPFNQGLKLPLASESFVDQSVIDDGLFVTVPTYFNQSIGDVVELAFGSLTLETTVTALGDVIFELTPEMLATLAPTNNLIVRYEVFDRVENASGWSDALVLPFKPGVVLLAAPIFEQADPDNVLQYDWLVGGPTMVLVTGIFAVNDVINLTLQGHTRGGDPVTHIYTRKMSAAGRRVDFPIENERVRNLIGGSLRATYELTKGTRIQLSKPADVTITGTSQPLGLPVIEPLLDGKLPVDTVVATVSMAPYWPLKTGAKVQLRWQTTDQDGIVTLFIFQLIVSDPTQLVTFKVPTKYISPYASTPLTVQNTVTNPGEVEVSSGLLQLMFGDPVEIVLLPPFPVPPATDLIDPLGPLPTMRVAFPAALPQDRARLVQRQAEPGSQTFPATLLNQNQRANFVLNRALLVASQGTTIHLAWNLRRNEQRIASSPATEIVVKPIAEEDERLPTPRITNIDGIVDVIELDSENSLVVDEWPGQVPTQQLFLSYEGIDTAGNAVRYDDLEGEPSGTEKGLKRPLPLAWLKNLKNETDLTIRFSVVFRHGAQPVQFPRQTYRVHSLVELEPLITSVKTPQNVDIPHNGSTIATTVVVSGTASFNQKVEILVNGQPRVTLNTAADGSFSSTLSGFTFNTRTDIQIRALYGQNQTSPVRSLIVYQALQINTASMFLQGYRVYTGWPTTGQDFPGNTETRPASHGVAPITYSSSNPAVATVNANGKVTGLRNGSAYITVQDRFSTLSYLVTVTNVYNLTTINVGMTVAASINWLNSVRGSSYVLPAFSSMEQVYGPSSAWPQGPLMIWGMCVSSGCPAGYNMVYRRGQGVYCAWDVGQYWPWCLRPV